MNSQRIVCILVENEEIARWIHRKKIPMFDLEEFSTRRISQDASTMTDTDSIDQSRLKALEFIRLFLEKPEDDFCHYLIKNEQFSPTKSSMIYQMIQQYLFI